MLSPIKLAGLVALLPSALACLDYTGGVPTATSTKTNSKVIEIAAGAVFNGGWARYDRGSGAGINSNYGDTATLKNVCYDTANPCQMCKGCAGGCERQQTLQALVSKRNQRKGASSPSIQLSSRSNACLSLSSYSFFCLTLLATNCSLPRPQYTERASSGQLLGESKRGRMRRWKMK